MGFENRDYYRNEDWPREGGRANPVCRGIIAVCVVVFIGQMLSPEVDRWLALNSADVFHGQVWRLLTYAFCHGTKDLFHLLLNMVCLWWFGRVIEDRLGTREFLLFYLSAAVLSGVAHIGLETAFLEHPSIAVGASGSLMAVMAVFAMLFPRQQVLFMMLIPIEIRWLIAGFVVMDLVPVVAAIQGHQASDGIAHAAHLGGLLFGFVYHIFELRLSGWFDVSSLSRWWGQRKRQQNMKLYNPEPTDVDETDLDHKVDDLLRKITEQGESSLSDRERKFLDDASRRYRERTRT